MNLTSNTELAVSQPSSHPADLELASALSALSAASAAAPSTAPRRRTGKVARLPKTLRNQLNSLLDDGVPYTQIIQTLGPDAAHLTPDNLSEWKNGGYQDWLDEQGDRHDLSETLELAQDLTTAFNPYVLPENLVRIACVRIIHTLTRLTIGRGNGQSDASWLRALSAIPRITETAVKLAKLRQDYDLHLPARVTSTKPNSDLFAKLHEASQPNPSREPETKPTANSDTAQLPPTTVPIIAVAPATNTVAINSLPPAPGGALEPTPGSEAAPPADSTETMVARAASTAASTATSTEQVPVAPNSLPPAAFDHRCPYCDKPIATALHTYCPACLEKHGLPDIPFDY